MISTSKDEIKNRVLTFLKEHELAVIATATPDARPEAATIGYLVDDDLNFLFLTRKHSRKIRNITENPKVALVIGTSSGLNTVQVEGDAEIFSDKDPEFSDLLPKVSSIQPLYYGPLLKMEGTEFVIVKIKPFWLRWLDVNELKGVEEFYQLLP